MTRINLPETGSKLSSDNPPVLGVIVVILIFAIVLFFIVSAERAKPTLKQDIAACQGIGGEPHLAKLFADRLYMAECWLPKR